MWRVNYACGRGVARRAERLAVIRRRKPDAFQRGLHLADGFGAGIVGGDFLGKCILDLVERRAGGGLFKAESSQTARIFLRKPMSVFDCIYNREHGHFVLILLHGMWMKGTQISSSDGPPWQSNVESFCENALP